MKTTCLTAVFAALIVLFFALPSPAQEDVPVVNDIEIRGLMRVDERLVRDRIMQSVGGPFSQERVSEDVKGIFASGRFDDVRVEVEMFEGGVKLIYVVKEKPTLSGVELWGNDKLSDTDINEKLTISHGSSSAVSLINENAEKIRALYESKGYLNALVVPVMRKMTETRVFLTYRITEGEKVKIKKIAVEGNDDISSRKIKKAMKTRERGIFSFMTGSGYYEKAVVGEDLEKIKGLYFDRGYINAAVSEPVVDLTPDKKWMKITLKISEGDKYTISSVKFAGNKVYKEEELRDKVKSSSGDVFDKGRLGGDSAAVTAMYSDKGYAMVGVYPDVQPDDVKKQVKITFKIYEDEIYKVGRIDISGNYKTRDIVIRREMRLKEGDVFNGSLIRRSYQKIYNLNFFDEVNMKPEPDSASKRIDIGIEVKEKPTGMLSVGGGYSSLDKWIGTVDLTEGNLGGRGQYLRAKAEFSRVSTLYELSFTEPWLFGKPVSMTTSLYNTSRDYTDYEKTATGFSLGLGKSFMDYWQLSGTYRLEYATIKDISSTAPSFIKAQEGTTITSSFSPAIARDSRDNYLDPTSGSRNVVSMTFAGLGGDNRFYKLLLDSNWFFPVRSTAFSLRGRYGFATGLGDKELPLYERYYVGGIYTVRGLGFGEAGPPGAVGGTQELIFNLEYIFPLIEEVRLKGVMFYDVGSSYDDGVDLEELRQTAGAGIRWITPIGPLRLEWGKNLYPKYGEKTSRWEFAFGMFF